ncbi:MAG: hypothetical protein ACE5GQ_03330 [Nitrospinales bacterium]
MDIACGFLIFLAFFLVGDKANERWRFASADGAEAFVVCTALGLVGVSCGVALLAFLGLIYPAAAWVFLGTVFIVRAGRVWTLSKVALDRVLSLKLSSLLPDGVAGLQVFNCWVLGLMIFLALTLALAPPTATDALVYHLAVPKAYLQNHGIVNLPNNVYSFFPLQFEMIYLFCLMLKGDALAQLAGLGMALILLAALVLFYRRYLSARGASLVPVLFFSVPAFWGIASVAYVDLPVAGFIFLTFYAWSRWQESDRESWFCLMTIFAAAAVSTKLTAVATLPLAVLGILLRGLRGEGALWALKKILALAVVTALFLAPWWTRNFHYTGNPVAPFFMQVFEGEDGINWDSRRSALQFQYYQSFGMGRGLTDFLMLPVNLTFFSETHSLKFDGVIGVLYFLLIPGLFWLRRGPALAAVCHLAILFAIFLVSWFMQSQYIRLLAPSFVFLTLLLAYGFERMMAAAGRRKIPRRLAYLVLAGGVMFNLTAIGQEWLRKQPLEYLAGRESRDQYLARHIPSYPLFREINNALGEDAAVLFVYMRNLGYLCDRKFISDTFFEAHTLRALIHRDSSINGIAGQLRNMGVTHLLFDNRYVFGKDSAFSPEEREALRSFLNARGSLVKEEKGFYLYGL